MEREIENAIKLLKDNGYTVRKKPVRISIKPCVCGGRSGVWYVSGKDGYTGYIRKCNKCDLSGETGRTERECILNWNKAVENAEN